MIEFLADNTATVVAFLVGLTIVVFVHEMGHFWVARRNGVRVEVFSIGFGPELFGFNDRHGTRWKFAAVPLGGYVKMFGDEDASSKPDAEAAEEMSDEDKAVAFPFKSLGQKAAIVFAGPAANFIFAVIVYAFVFMSFGQPATPPVIGSVVSGSAAAEAGIQAGDRILAIDGEPIERYEEVQAVALLVDGTPLDIRFERGGIERTITVTPTRLETIDDQGTVRDGYTLGVNPPYPTLIHTISPDSPAERAGLEPEDRIVAAQGVPVQVFADFREVLEGFDPAQGPLRLTIERGDQRFERTLDPVIETYDENGPTESVARIGVTFSLGDRTHIAYGPFEAAWRGVGETVRVVEHTFTALGQMIAGDRGTEDLGGPIRIAQFFGQAAEAGVVTFLLSIALLSVNLGLINLFPIPVLDGGHLLMYGIEAVMGRPLGEAAQEISFRIGLAVVLGLMVFATWNDIVQLVGG
ncbi:RIP metalloprotease RseP [Roseospirillum parvum]|uniref:Zinc metalloprotease n=1 Tax=Roseospirillum parvum TaxID=83401 RepID=A0A1G7Y2D3_9PROT|nr:RIP metalloprotease RseP [Roseospirillum parvum]SDG90635.1 regulator of sigma E protease [Roseospirillum parvum]